MARGAAADLHLDLERREIELVVEDGDVADSFLKKSIAARTSGRCRS
jgi:hypothetical protein